MNMKTLYQVQSKFRNGVNWLDDHLPFDIKEEAMSYIRSEYKENYQYRIVPEEYIDVPIKHTGWLIVKNIEGTDEYSVYSRIFPSKSNLALLLRLWGVLVLVNLLSYVCCLGSIRYQKAKSF